MRENRAVERAHDSTHGGPNVLADDRGDAQRHTASRRFGCDFLDSPRLRCFPQKAPPVRRRRREAVPTSFDHLSPPHLGSRDYLSAQRPHTPRPPTSPTSSPQRRCRGHRRHALGVYENSLNPLERRSTEMKRVQRLVRLARSCSSRDRHAERPLQQHPPEVRRVAHGRRPTRGAPVDGSTSTSQKGRQSTYPCGEEKQFLFLNPFVLAQARPRLLSLSFISVVNWLGCKLSLQSRPATSTDK